MVDTLSTICLDDFEIVGKRSSGGGIISNYTSLHDTSIHATNIKEKKRDVNPITGES